MRTDILAIAQHGDAVGQFEDFVEAVADVDDADATFAQQAHDAEQLLDIAFSEGGGRFVHDQDLRVERERFGDFHPLPIADIQRADLGADIEIKDVEFGKQGFRPHLHLLPIDGLQAEPLFCRRVTHEDILGHRQLRV